MLEDCELWLQDCAACTGALYWVEDCIELVEDCIISQDDSVNWLEDCMYSVDDCMLWLEDCE